MGKRAVDLTLEELAALGGKAARQAVTKAQQRGLVVTGTVEFFDGKQSVSSLAELQPSGTVTLVEAGDENRADEGLPAETPFRRI